jgi:hypothetical protein
MDNTTNETETTEAPKNTVLLYTATALAVVGAAVVVTKTIRYASAVMTVVKQKKELKAAEAVIAAPLTVVTD